MILWKMTSTMIGLVVLGLLLNHFPSLYAQLPQPDAGPDFTVILIPDPQYYASTYPNIYLAQMQWVADHKTSDNIVFVASLGDNVDSASDLIYGKCCYKILDSAGIPYGTRLVMCRCTENSTLFWRGREAGITAYGMTTTILTSSSKPAV
jgi:hypothetical protein